MDTSQRGSRSELEMAVFLYRGNCELPDESAGLIEKRYRMVRDGDAGSDYDCDCQCVEGDSFFGISILAKLQTIPDDYYEAAKN